MDIGESGKGDQRLVEVGQKMTRVEADRALESAQRLVAQQFPSLKLEIGVTGEGGRWIRIPSPPGGDYGWSFWFYPNGERHIYADLSAPAASAMGKEHVLWYHPFELETFKGSPSRLAAAFEAEMLLVLHSRTRVTQRRGLLNWTIDLDWEEEPDKWRRIYRFLALRAGWHSPNATQRFATYFAPKLTE